MGGPWICMPVEPSVVSPPGTGLPKFTAPRVRQPFCTMPRCPDVVNTVESGSQLLDLVDTFIFDCDGVIWRGNEAIPGVKETLAALRRAGKRCFFVTNSAVKTPAEFADKFKKLGVDDAASPQDIYATNTATARWLASRNLKVVYCIGEGGLPSEMERAGIEVLGAAADSGRQLAPAEYHKLKLDPRVQAVVTSHDSGLNYYKLALAGLYLRSLIGETSSSNTTSKYDPAAVAAARSQAAGGLATRPDCGAVGTPRLFVSTNPDVFTPTEGGVFTPGGGLTALALAASTGRGAPDEVIGKPSQYLLDMCVQDHGLLPARTCMVGDRLDTDVLFGQRGGLHTLLVLSGATTREQLESDGNAVTPSFVAQSIAALTAAAEAKAVTAKL